MKSTYGTMYYVANMTEAVAFYKSTLGFAPTHESPEWTEFSAGGHNLCLHLKEKNQAYRDNGVLIFNAENVKSLFEKMKGDGLSVSGLHEVHPGAWSFSLKDKDQNEVSFYGNP